jgi:hypothetical protein
LRERSPPEADLVRRIAALEFEREKLTSRLNSLNGRVSRVSEKRRDADALPVGIIGGPMMQQFSPEGEEASDGG